MSFRTGCALALGLAAAAIPLSATAAFPATPDSAFGQAIATLESRHGGRLGVAVLDTATGRESGYRMQERFAMCSTHKVLLVAAVLSRVDAGSERLERRVDYGAGDLLDYAPVTRSHVGEGAMTVAALAAAAIQYSDNTAANLLLAGVGGPRGLTRYLRSLDDHVTRIDRNEPSLNTNLPGDVRDTTTPAAMVATMDKLLVGDALSAASRQQLQQWLAGNTTGDAKLRAGLDPAWKIGDKTGSGGRGASSDVAIVWPPGRPPLLVAVYYSGSVGSRARQSAVIAEVGRIIGTTFAGH